MVNFTIEEIREIMSKPDNIRNFSVIAHVDHGKSTLTDSLLACAGIISQTQAGDKRAMDTRKDEAERGITIKSTGVSLYFEYDQHATGDKEKFLLNIIDSPGHVDFSSEVTAALRVTDGALVVVDCIEGVAVQTETVLRQAMQEKIKPVLVVNKIDRSILELQSDGESMYQGFVKVIDSVNVIIDTYQHEDMGNLLVFPDEGSVCFGSGKDCWAFTLTKFARIYSKKFGIEMEKLRKKFWGDTYYNAKGKKWQNDEATEEGKKLKRAFVSFIMDPICKLCQAVIKGDKEQYEKLLKALELTLTQDEQNLQGKKLLKAIMSKWINAADVILEMCTIHLPSPAKAQKYRTKYLYQGPQDDEAAKGMKACDPKGPLMMYISKMVPNPDDEARFIAFGRILSGTVSAGKKVNILGPNFQLGKKEDFHQKSIQRVVVMMAGKILSIDAIPCGNTVGLIGIDSVIAKTGTITDLDGCHAIRNMKYSVSPVVRVSVAPKNQADLTKLVDGLKKLNSSDPLVVITHESNGEHIIAGCGELHVEICLKDLEEMYAKCPLIKKDPVVSYNETVTEESYQTCMSKSPNKHNRLYAKADGMCEDLCGDIELGSLTGPKVDPKERAKYMNEKYEWEKDHCMAKLWSFGPENVGANCLVDATKGVQYMNELKDSCESAWQWVTKEGVMTEENMRGIRINLLDCTLHADAIHRGAGQIIPTARKLYYACELTAGPRLQEPIFACDITCPSDAMGGVYTCLNQRRGTIIEEIPMEGTPLSVLKCYLPVAESFGFTGALRESTKGQAFPQCVFDHWETLQDDPKEEGSKTFAIVNKIRLRKGLKEGIPALDNFNDKL